MFLSSTRYFESDQQQQILGAWAWILDDEIGRLLWLSSGADLGTSLLDLAPFAQGIQVVTILITSFLLPLAAFFFGTFLLFPSKLSSASRHLALAAYARNWVVSPSPLSSLHKRRVASPKGRCCGIRTNASL